MPRMLLIGEPRGQCAERGVKAGESAYAEIGAFADGRRERGVLRAVHSLVLYAKGTPVHMRHGQPRWIDGPFTEAKEMVGGFLRMLLMSGADLSRACPNGPRDRLVAHRCIARGAR